jgi:hypothetical protein
MSETRKPDSNNHSEFWIVTVLLILFLGVAFYSEQAGQTVVEHASVSTYNARPSGSKALYELFGTVPYKMQRSAALWNSLSAQVGLLVVIEKFDPERLPSAKEVNALRDWTQNGGTLLYFVQTPARSLDPKDPLAGDVAIIDGINTAAQTAPATTDSPYTRQVGTISVASQVRLSPAPNAPYQTLFTDNQGTIAVSKPLGKGHVIIVANARMVSNEGIKEADNVVFLANVAHEAIGSAGKSRQVIAFDEYHHGVGFTLEQAGQQNWLSTLPLPIKAATWPFIALLVLLVYNGNRRFGVAEPLPLVPYRPSTDYVHSLARWYRRAEASDIAFETLYRAFLRDLAQHLDAAQDAPAADLQARIVKRYPQDAEAMTQLIARCEQITAGTRVPPADLIAIARQLEHFKRRLHLVG